MVNYKLKEQDVRSTREIIALYGFDCAVELAVDKSLAIIMSEPHSVLCIEQLSWSNNLLCDARKTDNSEEESRLRELSSFYRKVSHKVYWHQKRSGDLENFNIFIRAV